MMPDLYAKFFEIYEAYSTLDVEDLALPTFAGLWVLTLLIPLSGINRRDLATASAYVVYLMFSAVILIFKLPSHYIQLDITATSQLLTLVAIGITAALRWWFRDDLAPSKEEMFTAEVPEEVSE